MSDIEKSSIHEAEHVVIGQNLVIEKVKDASAIKDVKKVEVVHNGSSPSIVTFVDADYALVAVFTAAVKQSNLSPWTGASAMLFWCMFVSFLVRGAQNSVRRAWFS